MRKALIIGASGLVGNYLYKNISPEYEIIGTFQNYSLDNLIHLDITDKNAVRQVIYDSKPDFVFLPAAFTNVDLCEEKKELCWQINVEGVQNVASLLKGTQTKLTYFSTDYIFDGKNGPYSEDDAPSPLSVYGASKLEAEKIIAHLLNNFLIIRTTCIYGWEPQQKNFVLNLIKRINRKETVRVPIDQVTTPTYSGELSEISFRLAREDKRGIYNVASSSLISRYDFAILVAEIFGLDKNLIYGIKTQDLSQKAKRPLKGGLKIDKIKRELGVDMLTAKESLLRMKKEGEYGISKEH